MPRLARLLGLGALSGLLVALAFPPFDLTALAFLGLVPLLWALEELARASGGRPLRTWAGSAFGAGWAFGFVSFLSLLWWIVLLDAPTLTIPWVRYPGTAAIVAFLSLFPGLFALAFAWVRARTSLPPVVIAPPLFVVAEVARGSWELGFPWGYLGYSQVEFLPALQMASVTGVQGLTAWLVGVNALTLGLLRRGGRRAATAAALVLVIVVPIAAGALRLAGAGEGPTIRVALVQPNIGNKAKWDPNRRDAHFDNLAELSRAGVEQGAELVVWPETAAPCYLLRDRKWRPFVEELAADTRVPYFVGLPDYQVVREGKERRLTYTNTGALFDRNGSFVGRMDKIELVPFGERMPFSQYLSFLQKLDFGEADFVPGEETVVFDLGGARFGNLVCFEAIFPALPRRYAKQGANLLVNITNDSWFGAGSGAEQHAEMAIVRCVETGCGMARAANSGISMGVDAYGRRFGETPLFTREISVVDVPLREGATWYLRWGDWVPPVSGIWAAGLVLAGFLRRRG